MEWSAETSLNELWSGLDSSQTNGEVRRYLKQHLLRAYQQGREDALAQLETCASLSRRQLRLLPTDN